MLSVLYMKIYFSFFLLAWKEHIKTTYTSCLWLSKHRPMLWPNVIHSFKQCLPKFIHEETALNLSSGPQSICL